MMGVCNIYKYNGTTWNKIGVITSSNFILTVSKLNENGTIIVVGRNGNNTNGYALSYLVYKYNGSVWNQYGSFNGSGAMVWS